MATLSPEPIYTLRGHEAEVNYVKFHPANQDMLLSGGSEGSLKIWKLSRRRVDISLDKAHVGGNGGTICIESLTNNRIMSQGRDGFIKIWDLNQLNSTENQLPIQTIETDVHSFCKLSCLEEAVSNSNETNKLVAISREDPERVIEVYDVNTSKAVHTLKEDKNITGSTGLCLALKLFRKNQDLMLAASYENGSIYFWNLTSGQLVTSANFHKEPSLCFDLDSTFAKGISGSAATNIAVFSVDYEQPKCEVLQEFTINNGGISFAKVRPDDRICATAGWDHRIRIFDWKKLKPLAILKYHTAGVYALDFAPTSFGNLMASGAKDKRIAIWSLY